MSAATIDRALRPVRALAKQGRRKISVNTQLRKSITIRTYEDWNNPPPGYFEMDLVAHCGSSVAGSHVHSLVLTDIASGWTEAAALIVREQTLITVTLDEIQSRLPFSMLGLDVDNDSAFINQVLLSYCRKHKLELTCCLGKTKSSACAAVLVHASSSRGYNGADFGRNLYDTKLAAAFHRYQRPPLPEITIRTAQMLLLYAGSTPGVVDGLIVKLTRAAARGFRSKPTHGQLGRDR